MSGGTPNRVARRRRRATPPMMLVLALTVGCGEPVRQMATAGLTTEVQLAEADVWKPLGPPVVLRTSEGGTLTALFVGECLPKLELVDRVSVGFPLEIRIKFDDEVGFPDRATLAFENRTPVETSFQSHSFLAFLRNVAPGTHTILAEWRSPAAGARMRSRTLTVWQSVSTAAERTEK